MPEDLPLLLKVLAVAIPISLVGGLTLRFRFPRLCEQYRAWATSRIASRRWWVFVLYAAFFLLMASAQFCRHWFSFAALFAAFAVFELVLMAWAYLASVWCCSVFWHVANACNIPNPSWVIGNLAGCRLSSAVASISPTES